MKELSKALAAAQGEIEPAPKDADNPFFKSRYATLSAIREAIRQPFAKNGLSIIQMPEVVVGEAEEITTYDKYNKPKKKRIDGELRLHTLLLHSSGETMECGTIVVRVDTSDPQKLGSAITYARRYALAAVSQTCADEDDDGNAASQPPPQQQRGGMATQPPTAQPPRQTKQQAATAAQAPPEAHPQPFAPMSADDARAKCGSDEAICVIEAVLACGMSGGVGNVMNGVGAKELEKANPTEFAVVKEFATGHYKQLKSKESQGAPA